MASWPELTRKLVTASARWVPRGQPDLRRILGAAAACALAGAAIRFAVAFVVGSQLTVVIFFPFILLAALVGGGVSGILSLAFADMIADYFWLPPSGFGLNRESAVTLIGFTVICIVVIFLAVMIRSLIDAQREAEERATILANEMRHRTLNILAIVQGVATQTAREAQTPSGMLALINERLAALSRVQRMVGDRTSNVLDLRTLLTESVRPYGVRRIAMMGPDCQIPLNIASACALVFNELGANATKYGALSTPEGHISLAWEQNHEGLLLRWREMEGPQVNPPARHGFGTQLLANAFPPGFGRTEVNFLPDGLRCAVQLRLT